MKKTILITGSTDGIGLQTAKKLFTKGHTVLLHGRSANKLAAAEAEIGGTAASYVADLSNMDEVKKLADTVKTQYNRLDVLINNAGVLKVQNPVLDNDLDVRFVVNTFAPYILTQLALPIIPKGGRVVNLSSAAQAPVNTDAMIGKVKLDEMNAYAQSKLAITIWSRELAKTLSDGPNILAVNPGSLLASKMVKDGFGVAGKDINIGADILCDAALGDRFSDASGTYFDNDNSQFSDPHPSAFDTIHVERVMREIKKFAEPYLQS
ncbi:MAG: SDR family NAD(P)-dependent oxidoreductase [Hyphomicrobiales bacterium]